MTSSSIYFRVSLIYWSVFFVLGAQMQFLPAWLELRGITPAEIGTIFAVATVLRALVMPLAGYWIDKIGHRARIVALLSVATALNYLAFLISGDLFIIAALVITGTLLSAPVIPVAESIGVGAAERHKLDYGRMRLWGSVSFILSGYLAGEIFERAGLEWLPIWLAVTSVFLAVTALFVPRGLADPKGGLPPTVATALQLLRDRPLVTMMCGTGFIQGSHAVFYSLGTVHWLGLGYSESTVALLWATGVVTEVIFLWFIVQLEMRVGLWGLALLGGAAGLVRWTVMAFDPVLAILFVMQALHALTFAAAHVAVVRYIGRNVAGNLSTTAQTLNSALHGGVFLAVGFWLGGAVYSISPAYAFWLMAGFALVGSLVLLAGMRTNPKDPATAAA